MSLPKSHRVCALADIVPNTGVCALVDGRQVAVFRMDDDRVFALANLDPFSKANVLSRGIVGDLKGELVVASPVYKQHFSLLTGRCVEDPAVEVLVFPARVEDGQVLVDAAPGEVSTTCCYCGVGCGVVASVAGKRITSVRGDPGHPANRGKLCSKGMSLHRADPRFRGLFPEIRNARATWDEALDFAASGFRRIIEQHGPDAVAFYISGQFLTEDYYVFNKLAKGLIGTNNIDTNSRLCMASAVAGYKQTLGADAPPACYDDIEQAECVFIAGSNTAWAHPVLYRRIEAARPKHVIVVDPRRTETACAATLHLQIVPGTDVALFSGMLDVIRSEGWLDEEFVRSHTEGFADLPALASAEAAAICGVAATDLREAARLFASSRATLSLYCQGLNQSTSGTAKNAALINLHLATGQIGKPGAGPLSLTGQPNAMGGREVGGMANLLSAHRDLASEEDRKEIARFWGVPDVPAQPGRTAVEMFEAIRRGEIKAVWIACTNPAHSLPDQKAVREALERAELVVVQDAYRNTETAAYAHLYLPAAGWGEKEGTMTNSERRISRVRAAVPPPGEAREDWRIAVDFARRLGGEALFPYEESEDIFAEHRETTRGRDLDITGLSYALLEERGPQQWPFPQGATEGRQRLYEDGVFPTPSGRARFLPTPYRPVAEETHAAYPLRLTTGRLRDQWHTMSRTGTIARLLAHEPEPRIQLHPEDLSSIGASEGELMRVASPRGEAYFQASADADLPKGTAFVAMHWGRRFLARGVNELTLGALDPVSKQPELKHSAIRVEPANLAWRFVASGTPKDVAALFNALDFAMDAAPYVARTLIGRERAGVRLSLAAAQAVDVERIREIFREHAGETASYADTARGRVLCNCFDVAEADVDAFLRTSKSLGALQTALKCGTSCGSCLPEVRRKVAA
jgi:assimilatory nitrate reductase catalytic subunit